MRASSDELEWLHKPLAVARAELLPRAEETAEVIPYLQVFYLFQVMAAARRDEAPSLPWKYDDFAAGTAFLPETKSPGVKFFVQIPRDLKSHRGRQVSYFPSHFAEA